MFSSDVSARGVDYPDVTLVLQVGTAAGRVGGHRAVGRCTTRAALRCAAELHPGSALRPLPRACPVVCRLVCPAAASSTSTGWGVPLVRARPGAASSCSRLTSAALCASSGVSTRAGSRGPHARQSQRKGGRPTPAASPGHAGSCARHCMAWPALRVMSAPCRHVSCYFAGLPVTEVAAPEVNAVDVTAVRNALPRMDEKLNGMVRSIAPRQHSMHCSAQQPCWPLFTSAGCLGTLLPREAALLARGCCAARRPPVCRRPRAGGGTARRRTPRGWGTTTAPRESSATRASWCRWPTTLRE